MPPSVAITLDTDWAPDFVIEWVADQLVRRGLRATWFITHRSSVIASLEGHAPFERGIHPNFLPGSSHGPATRDVLAHCLEIVPEARSMRTHALVQSTPILETVMAETPIATDVSILTPGQPVAPFTFHLHGRSLVRVPYHWEDDVEMGQPTPCWELAPPNNGHVFVLDFHPIHVYLNSADFSRYLGMKRIRPRLADLTPDEVAPFINPGLGTRTAFLGLLDRLTPSDTCCIRDIRPA